MSALAAKLRRARETEVEAGGHRFTIRRPTDAEALVINHQSALDVLAQFTVGWNLHEIDLIPGGSPVAVPFDTEDFREWVSDQPSVINVLADAVVQAYLAHVEKRSAAEKN